MENAANVINTFAGITICCLNQSLSNCLSYLKIPEVHLQRYILPLSLLMLFIEMFSLVFFLHRLVYSDKQEDG